MHETIQSCTSKSRVSKWQTAVFAALLFILLLGLSQGASLAQDRPLPYREYLSLIGQIRGEALNAQSQQGDGCNARLESLAAQLNQITQIQMPDGAIVQVDHAQAGLPFTFPYCNPINFVRFLNGICPEEVCLTSGVVIQPNETPANISGEEITLVDLVDFSNSDPLDQLPPEEPPDSITNAVEGAPIEESTGEGIIGGDTAVAITVGGETVVGEGATSEGATGESGSGNGATGAGTVDEGAAADDAVGETTANEGTGEANPLNSESPNPELGSDGDFGPEGLSENPIVDPAVENRPTVPPWVIIVFVLLLLIIVVVTAVYIQRSRQPAPLYRETEKQVEENVQTGRQLLSKGEYREAIHKLFNATLAILADRGLIRYESYRTNYEILGSASTAPLLISHLSPVVEAYDRVWYGLEPLETAEFEALVEQIEGLRTLQRH